jgi:DNA-binding NarL/FixJ family response regulator
MHGRMPTVCILHAREARERYEEILAPGHVLHFFPSLAAFADFERLHAHPERLLRIENLRPRGETILDSLRSQPRDRLRAHPWIGVGWVDALERVRECYALGAAEYLSAPLRRGELRGKVERVASLLEEGGTLSSDLALSSDLELDPVTLSVRRGGRWSDGLTAKEFQILSLLARAPRRGLERSEIRSRVWRHVHVGPKTLEVHLAHLRQKLGPLGLSISVTRPTCIALADFRNPLARRVASGTDRPFLRRTHRRAQPCRRSSSAAAEPFAESAPRPL